MLLYLDLNCFNRPFDDQAQERVVNETAAVLTILQRVVDGSDTLAWSAILTYENSNHPMPDRRAEISRWAGFAAMNVAIGPLLITRARQLVELEIPALDAAHVASAEEGRCDRFLTCDDRLIRKARRLGIKLSILNPIEYLKEVSNG
jgi:hypothetical protein